MPHLAFDVDVFKICGMAMLCLAAIWMLRQWRTEMSFPVRAVGSLLIFGMVLTSAKPIVELISSLSQQSMPSAYGELLISRLGISLVCTLGAGICRDFGEAGLASTIESAGKIAVVLQALPLIGEILEMTKELLS
jgi:stage III sporulation protein AD